MMQGRLQKRHSFVVTVVGLVAACGGSTVPVKTMGNDVRSDESVGQTAELDAGGAEARESCVWIEVFEILERVYFDPGSARLAPRKQPIVDAIADTINANPRIEKLGVVGGRAPDEPDALSHDRAMTVVNALVAKGVPARRLEAHGYLGPLNLENDRKSVWFVMLRVGGEDARPATGDARWIPWQRDCEASQKAHREQGAALDCDCVNSHARH